MLAETARLLAKRGYRLEILGDTDDPDNLRVLAHEEARVLTETRRASRRNPLAHRVIGEGKGLKMLTEDHVKPAVADDGSDDREWPPLKAVLVPADRR